MADFLHEVNGNTNIQYVKSVRLVLHAEFKAHDLTLLQGVIEDVKQTHTYIHSLSLKRDLVFHTPFMRSPLKN